MKFCLSQAWQRPTLPHLRTKYHWRWSDLRGPNFPKCQRSSRVTFQLGWDMIKLSKQIIGVLEILAAGIFGYVSLNLLVTVDRTATFITFVGIAMGIGAALLNLVAGILLLTSNSKAGFVLSCVNTALQIPTFNLPGFVYLYVGLGQIYVGTSSIGLVFGANISPGRFFVGQVPVGDTQVTLNLVAIAFTLFLWRSLRDLGRNQYRNQAA
jgi:hypothetical protein